MTSKTRLWPSYNKAHEVIVQGALEWLEKTQDKPLDEILAEGKGEDDGMPAADGDVANSLLCKECGKKFRGQAQAEFHASKSGHVDFEESTEELAPLTEEQKKEKLEELRAKLAEKRAGQSEQDKIDKKRNEVGSPPSEAWRLANGHDSKSG